MTQYQKEVEHAEKKGIVVPREPEIINIEDIDDLIFRDSVDIKTHSER